MSLAVALALFGSVSANAFNIDTGNPDIDMRWDNSIRYNAGWRMEGVNSHFAKAFGSDETETRFGRGDMVTNRLDLLSEFDFRYQRNFGFRVSAALWSENAYGSSSKTNPALDAMATAAYGAPVQSNYGPGGKYSSYAKHYLTGNSSEFLDAFVFGSFQLGQTSLKIRAGQHNVYWGDALYTIANGISAGQGPIDTIKAATSPGAEAKELFMPLNQISAQWQFSDEVAINAQYLLDWKPFRLVPGGTYFSSGGDGLAPCASVLPAAFLSGTCLSSLDAITPGRNGGDYGLALRWTPEWIGDGTMGFYYRKYDEKLPWNGIQYSGAGPMTNLENLGLRLVYARGTELFGVSMSKSIAGVSVGAELSYRKNTALNSAAGYVIGSGGTDPNTFAMSILPLTTAPSYSAAEGARGDTWHGVLNGIYLLPKTALWESGVLQGEISYQRLDKVTKNANLFYSTDHACKHGYLLGGIAPGALKKGDGCSTRDAWTMSVGFTPQWAQVLPGWDLDMPTSLTYGLKGNGPTIAGGLEGAYNWSIGLKAKYRSAYEFGLAYVDAHTDYKTGVNPGSGFGQVPTGATSANGSVQNNHGWLSFTFKTSL